MYKTEDRITLRLPKALHDALKRLAQQSTRSLNGQIVHILWQYIRHKDGQ